MSHWNWPNPSIVGRFICLERTSIMTVDYVVWRGDVSKLFAGSRNYTTIFARKLYNGTPSRYYMKSRAGRIIPWPSLRQHHPNLLKKKQEPCLHQLVLPLLPFHQNCLNKPPCSSKSSPRKVAYPLAEVPCLQDTTSTRKLSAVYLWQIFYQFRIQGLIVVRKTQLFQPKGRLLLQQIYQLLVLRALMDALHLALD
jgi:hypothetical protein